MLHFGLLFAWPLQSLAVAHLWALTYDKLSVFAVDLERAICLKQQLGQSGRFAFATLCQNFVSTENCEWNFTIDFMGILMSIGQISNM